MLIFVAERNHQRLGHLLVADVAQSVYRGDAHGWVRIVDGGRQRLDRARIADLAEGFDHGAAIRIALFLQHRHQPVHCAGAHADGFDEFPGSQSAKDNLFVIRRLPT